MFLVRTMQLSGGLYSYNRFDAYEEALKEGSGASTPEKMKKKVDKESKKARKTGRGLVDYDENEEEKEESEGAGGEAAGGAMGEGYMPMNKAKIGKQADKAFGKEQAAVKAGDEAGANKQMQRRIAMKNPAGKKAELMKKEEVESFFIEDEEGNIFEGKKDACYHKVKSRYDVWPSAYASGALVKCRKAGAKNWGNSAKKESFVDDFGNEYLLELNNEETKETVMENRMAMYSRALGVMGAHYSGPGFGVSGIEEKKEVPDFIKDKMKEKHDKAHEDDDKDEKKSKKKDDKEECNEAKKADKDYDGDGKVESSKAEYFGSKDKAIKKAMKENREMAYGGGKAGKGSGDGSKPAGIKGGKTYTMKGKDGKPLFKEGEEVSITKEAVVEYLVTEGYANNEVSAEILHQHISDEFLAKIEEQMLG